MPKAFEECVRKGGRVRTIKPRPDVYIHVCYPKDGGKPVVGEVHYIKKSKLAEALKNKKSK